MMGLTLPTQDQIGSATALLAALSDPKAVQARLDALTQATQVYEKARAEAVEKIQAAMDAQTSLESRTEEVAQRELACRSLQDTLTTQQAGLAQARASLATQQQDLQALTTQAKTAQDAREADLLTRESTVALRETAAADREKALIDRETAVAAREAKIKAAFT